MADLKAAVEKLFAELDKDNSGKVSCAELKEALQSSSDVPLDNENVKAFFDMIDVNKDGELSLDEFLALF